MDQKKEDKQLKSKLDEIRGRLLASPAKEELTAMQLHLEVLEQWVRVSNAADADHMHNHMSDHDNTAFVEPFLSLTAQEVKSTK